MGINSKYKLTISAQTKLVLFMLLVFNQKTFPLFKFSLFHSFYSSSVGFGVLFFMSVLFADNVNVGHMVRAI
jgi:hypothetical protein